MKTFAWPRTILILAAVAVMSPLASAQGVRIDLDHPAAPAAPAPKKDDKKKADEKKKDEMGKIEGIEISRGGNFMGIQLVNGTFKLSFYNAKKKPIAPDVTRAFLRWKVNYQPNLERTVLNQSGNDLVSEKVVKPPYNFPLTIVLAKGDDEASATESFTVDFHQG